MSKQVSLAACIAKMYDGATRDNTGDSGAGSAVKKPNSSQVISNLNVMDNKLNVLDAKVEKIVSSQGDVLKKLDMVYQGIGNLEKDMAKLQLMKEPTVTAESFQKCDSTLFSEIRSLNTETVKLLKCLQQDGKKQREKIDGIEHSVSAINKVIKFVGETFRSSKIVEYILKGTVPWRKGSLLESNEEKKDKSEERSAKPRAACSNRAVQAEIRRSFQDDKGVEKIPKVENADAVSTTEAQVHNPAETKAHSVIALPQAPNEKQHPQYDENAQILPAADKLPSSDSKTKVSHLPEKASIRSREHTQTQTFTEETHNVGVNTEEQGTIHQPEEVENINITIVACKPESDVTACTGQDLHKEAAETLERIPDTTQNIPATGLQSKKSSSEEKPPTLPSRAALEHKEMEQHKSSKPAVSLPKNDDSYCKKDLKSALMSHITVSPVKQQPKPNAQPVSKDNGPQMDSNTATENKAEQLPSHPQSEPFQLLSAGTAEPEAAEANGNQVNKEPSEANPLAVALENSQEEELIVIDDSPPLPAPFEHRIVSTKQLPVSSYYTVSYKEVLGGGRFGQVVKCAELSSGLTLAAKIIKVKGAKDREEVKNEIGVMNQLNHVNLIQLYDAFESKNNLTLIMEYVDGGELFDRIVDDNYHLTELDAIVFTRQICEGVQYLHQQYILHLDLKPENILCVNNTGNQIKIIDFGLARKYKPREKLKVNFGTPEFLAPEVVNYDYVSFPTDMWSVGVITYMLLSGLSPFLGDNDTETMNNILHGNWDFDAEAFENVSSEAKDFISRLLVLERSSRLSASGCMKHEWLNNLADKAKIRRVRLKSQLRLQRYLAHRQWKKHFYVVAAANRLKKFRQGRSVNPALALNPTRTKLE
nr:PREDICTED: myosin light chain kinase 3 isoform X1 [Lepisosteus oculatus]